MNNLIPYFFNYHSSINVILYLEYIELSGRGNILNENDKILDSSYYQMSRFAYRGDEKLGNSIEVTDNKGNPLQK